MKVRYPFLPSTRRRFTIATLGVALICSLQGQDNLRPSLPETIGIEQVVQLSLANQFRISIGRIEQEQATEDTRIAAEPFEARLSVEALTFRDANSDPNNFPYSVEGSQQSIALSRSFSTGTSVDLALNSDHFQDLETPRSGEAMLTLQQNLLRGRSRAYNLAPIRIASKQSEISTEALRQTVIDTLTAAQFAYFDALLAEANLNVARESLALAEQLLQENHRRSEIGSIAPSDILQAEAEVAARQDRVYQAEATLVRAINALKQSLSNQGIHTLQWEFTLLPPPTPQALNIELIADYEAALQNRPDYRQSVLSLDIGEIEALRQSHATLPDLNLFFQMSLAGWGDSFDDTFAEVGRDARPNYAVGMSLSRSLSNRASQARKSIARLEHNRRQMSLLELEQAILLDLHTAAAQIESNWKRLTTASQGRKLAEQSLDAEQKRFQTGISSTFILIRLQTDLANAQIRELIAANDYRKSVVEWERQTGTLLQRHHIEL